MHDGKMDHAHKEVRPSAYIFDTQLTLQYGSSAALFLSTGAGGNIANRAISLLLRAPEVMTDFFMCITSAGRPPLRCAAGRVSLYGKAKTPVSSVPVSARGSRIPIKILELFGG